MPTDENPQDLARLRAIVHGRVQGVNFRYYTECYAAEHGLTGWVRNLPDRTVETVAEGARTELDGFVEFLHKGSPHAAVTQVDVTWQEASGEFDTFETVYFDA